MITTFLRAQRTRIFWVVLLLILSGVGLNSWYRSIYSDPRRVFSAMIENALQTGSVTKKVTQIDANQSLEQTVRLQTGKEHIAHGVTNISQQGAASATVMTESIGTPTTDYVRYRSIETDQKGVQGNDLDFSEVVGVWGETPSTGETSGDIYNETALGVIPFGNVSNDDRKRLMSMVRELDVYRVEYANVQRVDTGGRAAYEYTVKVLPQAYVAYLKEYARSVGLTHLENINPDQYANADAIEFTVRVDILSRRLVGITYQNGREERFVSYGGRVPVSKPTETISVDELQEKIQSVQ